MIMSINKKPRTYKIKQILIFLCALNLKKEMLTPFKNTSRRTPENRLLGIRFVKLNSGGS